MNTAQIVNHRRCKTCKYPVIHACCNNGFHKGIDEEYADWWWYCTNKGCVNHKGEDAGQSAMMKGFEWIESGEGYHNENI